MSRWIFVKANAVPWEPTDVSGLMAWYKADEISQSDDTEISEWSDASGNGYHMSGLGTPKPKFRTSVQNGLGVVRFNGTGFFERAVWTGYPDNNEAITIGAVFKNISSANHMVVTAGVSGGPRQDNVRVNSNGDYSVLRRQADGSFRYVESDSAASIGYQTYVAGINASAEAFMRSNGAAVAFSYGGAYSNLTLANNTPSHVGLGSFRGIDKLPNDAEIAEVVMYDSAISESDQQKLEGYLAWKWGLESSLASGHPYENAAP